MRRGIPTLAQWPFRYWLPGAMLLMTLVAGSAVYMRRGGLSDAFVERNSLGDLPVEATSLQRVLEYLLAHDGNAEAQQLLAEKRADPDIVTALLADDRDTIAASANRGDLGQPLTEGLRALIPAVDELRIAESIAAARAQMAGQIRSGDRGNLLVAVYPVVFGSEPGQLRPRRIGVLILSRDLRRMKAEERREATRGIPALAGAIILIAGIVVVLAHFTIARRAEALVAATRALAAGESTARARLEGRDELAVIGSAFDDMADEIARARQVTIESEARLRRSEEQFRLALDASPAAMILTDDAGTIRLVNVAAERVFGYAPDELLGKPVDLLLPEATRGRHAVLRAEYQSAPYTADGSHRQLTGLRKDGRRVPIEIGLNPIRSDQGVFVLASVVDVTERLKAEAERSHLEAQLRQSQKMDALGTLAGGVAHDFNNILTIILGNVWLLQQQSDSPLVQQAADEIDKAGTRARHLVQQILRFTRQEPHLTEELHLPAVIQEDVSLLRATIPAGVELACVITPGCPPVLADRTSIHQVLLNLCTNAWHAMDGRSGHITIRLDPVTLSDDDARHHLTLKPGRYVRLTVSDDGKGMDATTREKIFDPFFTTKPVGQGTGLGLSVVHGVVKNLGGDIVVRSEPGRGTDFELYFPAHVAAGPVRAGTRSGVEGPATVTGEHVLYVDDEESLLKLAERALTAKGYRFTGAAGPDAAIAVLMDSASSIDIVVSDLNMPSRSGIELAQTIRSFRPDLPIIITSGLINDDLRAKADAAGVRMLLPKPYTGADLHKAIAGALRSTPVADRRVH